MLIVTFAVIACGDGHLSCWLGYLLSIISLLDLTQPLPLAAFPTLSTLHTPQGLPSSPIPWSQTSCSSLVWFYINAWTPPQLPLLLQWLPLLSWIFPMLLLWFRQMGIGMSVCGALHHQLVYDAVVIQESWYIWPLDSQCLLDRAKCCLCPVVSIGGMKPCLCVTSAHKSAMVMVHHYMHLRRTYISNA